MTPAPATSPVAATRPGSVTKPGCDAITARITERLPGARVVVVDDSHLHAGHTGAAGGGGHYTATVVAESFIGLARIARHRLVYDALADWMPARIHALAVRALTPAEEHASPLAEPSAPDSGAASRG